MTEPDQVSLEAGRWDARLRSPDCSDDERMAFARWKANAAHAAEFDRLQAALSLLGQAALDIHAARSPFTPRNWRRRLALAASLAIVCVGIATLSLSGRNGKIYTASTAASRSLRFEDGSRIEIRPGSSLDVRSAGGERHVTLLRGQASFTIEPGPAKPFVVRAGDRRVTAQATIFDIRLTAARVQVGLRKGTADVHCWHGLVPSELTLRAGDTLDAEIGSDRATRTTGTI